MEQKELNRHDLLFLTPAGKEKLLLQGEDWPLATDFLKDLLEGDWPVILKSQGEAIGDKIEVGLSFPVRQDGVRLRCATVIPLAAVKKVVTPYAVADGFLQKLPLKQRKALKKLQALVGATLQVGLFGSYALEAVTGRAYTHPQSDLDFILKGSFTPDAWSAFLTAYLLLKEELDFPLDGEVYLKDAGSVKVGELINPPQSVLIKGLYSAYLMPRGKHLIYCMGNPYQILWL